MAEKLADHELVHLGDPVQNSRVSEVGSGIGRRERTVGRAASGEVELGRLLGEERQDGLVAGAETSDGEGHRLERNR